MTPDAGLVDAARLGLNPDTVSGERGELLPQPTIRALVDNSSAYAYFIQSPFVLSEFREPATQAGADEQRASAPGGQERTLAQ